VKLSDKLAISTSVIMVFAVFFVFFNIHNQLTTSTKDIEITRYQHELKDIINRLESTLNKVTEILNTIGVVNSATQNYDLKLKADLEFYLKNNKEMREIKYIALNGSEIQTVSTEKLFVEKDTKNYANEPFFKMVMEKGYFIGELYFSPISNDMMVDVATRVIDVKDTKTVGVLYSKISLNTIQETIADRLVDFDSLALQSLHTKQFLYKSHNAKRFEENIYDINLNLATIEQDGDSYIMVCDSYINSDFKVKIFVFMKEEKIFAQINETIKNNLYLLIFVILLSFFIVTTIVTKILKPLRVLVNQIIAKSNKIDNAFATNIVLDSDEVANMERYFNKYIKLLEFEKDKINDLNANLQKKVDEEIEKSKKKDFILFEQVKNAQMGEMIGNIAHQWRQPLSVISTSASGILMKKELGVLSDEKENEMLESIINTALFLSKTIDTFRNYIKEDKELKDVVLQEALHRDISIIEASLTNNYIQLTNDIDRIEPLTIKTLSSELSQVIINLFNNAKDAIVERKIEEPFIKISLNKEDNKAIITIEDNGGGIAEDIFPKIFDPYFTTKHQSQGTGLGLYMSKDIIEKHLHGKLYATNGDFGAIFTIELPLHTASIPPID
jgi:signal transduction histidine kinase